MEPVIRLKIIEEADLPTIREWVNLPTVHDFMQTRTPLTEPEVRQKFLKTPGEMKEFHFLVIDNKNERPIGVASLKNLHWLNRRAEISLFIGKEHSRGKGLGKAATIELLRFAFDKLNLQRIFLEVYDFNATAIAMYEKVGFREEGRLRKHSWKNGAYRDLVIMGILREEFSPA